MLIPSEFLATMKFILFVLFCYINLITAAQGIETSVQVVLKGNLGAGPGQIGRKVDLDYNIFPSTIAVDPEGNIYIYDHVNEGIHKFSSQGRFLFKIAFKNVNKLKFSIVNDLTTDAEGNLYAASRSKGKIFKYSSQGKLTGSINLDDKDIYWDWYRKTGWVRGAVQIEDIVIDKEGNIYLRGSGELIKFDPAGNVTKKWPNQQNLNKSVAFFLDSSGNLFLKWKDAWEKYDKHGSQQARIKCGDLPYFPVLHGDCNYPHFIDKNGFLYFVEHGFSGKDYTSKVVKVDVNSKRYGEFLTTFYIGLHNTKFDQNGNLYLLGGSKTEFWVKRISFNN